MIFHPRGKQRMTLTEQEQNILRDMEKARSAHPELAEILTFYEKIFRAQFAFKERLKIGGKEALWGKKEIRPDDLAEGRPQVRFEDLEVEPAALQAHGREILALLIPYAGGGNPPESEPSAEELMVHAREIFLSQGPPVVSGSAESLVKTAAGLALSSHLQLACAGLHPRIPQDSWYREYCPVCGGRPSFTALTSDREPRTLFCPRCFGEWIYGRVGCPFCGAKESQTYYPSDDNRYRLYVCGVCDRYLKTADVRDRTPDFVMPVAALVTVSMDIAAKEKGYKFI
jgi:hypothetical protein